MQVTAMRIKITVRREIIPDSVFGSIALLRAVQRTFRKVGFCLSSILPLVGLIELGRNTVFRALRNASQLLIISRRY